MAGAKPGVHVVKLKPIEVPRALLEGEKFVKWDDDSTQGVPVTLKVDPGGFFLCWTDLHQDTELLEISSIRDTRVGKCARVPKDPKLRETVTMGSAFDLEDKTLTVVYGADFVNVQFINFCCKNKGTAKMWADEIMSMAYNLLALNASARTFLEKAYVKLVLSADRNNLLPVKDIVRMFTASSRDDRKRVEKALFSSLRYDGRQTDNVAMDKWSAPDFMDFYRNLTDRKEVRKIYDELRGRCGDLRPMTAEEFMDFLNLHQRDPRLNEILYPYADLARARELILQYEPDKAKAVKGDLTFEGFLDYLLGEDNVIVPPESLDLSDDMSQPLPHYFINSSHNTYLIGPQLTGRSSVEMYRQCLLAGCRSVELDFWNGSGKSEEPIIVHGYTFVSEISAKDVIEAIADAAFKTSDFPVILSFENHCNPKQQAKIAQYCREKFGSMLLDQALDGHPLEPGVPLPSPQSLLRKIIIKNKKKHGKGHHHHHHHHHHHGHHGHAHGHRGRRGKEPQGATGTTSNGPVATGNAGFQGTRDDQNRRSKKQKDRGTASVVAAAAAAAVVDSPSKETGFESGDEARTSSEVANGESYEFDDDNRSSSSSDLASDEDDVDGEDDDDDFDDEEDEEEDEDVGPTSPPFDGSQEPVTPGKSDKGTAGQEVEAGAALSALVNYVQPVHFVSFEHSEKRARCYEMSSFVETQATALLKETPVEFVNYNKRQLSRVYPRGTRVDSSNFTPQTFWNAGCQLVALNFQSLDLPMQLNLGIFEFNNRCGFLLKPDFMRRSDRRFDPFAESTVDGIIAGMVSVQVISGQFLTDKKVGTFVEVNMYGLPADTVRRKFRTKIVQNNAINPFYDEAPFVFKKVVLPELAVLRFAVFDESQKLLGHRVLPVVGLRPGYRHIPLRNDSGQPLAMAAVFVHIVAKDYVPDAMLELAEALANPIASIKQRENQLKVLTEDENELLMLEGRNGGVANADWSPSTRPPLSGMTSSASIGGSELSPPPLQQTLSATSSSSGGASSLKNSGLASPPFSSGDVSPLPGRQNSVNKKSQSIINKTVASACSSIASVSGGEAFLGDAGGDHALRIEAIPLRAESLASLQESKSVKEKVVEMEKLMEKLRKKHKKDRIKFLTASGVTAGSATSLGASSSSSSSASSAAQAFIRQPARLVKKYSSKKIDKKTSQSSFTSSIEGDDEPRPGDAIQDLFNRQLRVEYEQFIKCQESMLAKLEKAIASSQASQLKMLEADFEKEKEQVRKRISANRRLEIKSLTQKHKDKDELNRMKREMDNGIIARGVDEMNKLNEGYQKKKLELERQHQQVNETFAVERSLTNQLWEEHVRRQRDVLKQELAELGLQDVVKLEENLGHLKLE